MGRVTLVTCFYAKDLERFRNLAWYFIFLVL
jgi:hypothetical protein